MSTPDPIDDDAIAEALADEVLDRILSAHPNATAEFRKKLVRLYMRQATGREAVAPSARSLAEYFGMTHQRVSETTTTALAKAWREYQERFPNLSDLL